MTVTGQTHVPADRIWRSWEQAHVSKGSGGLSSGASGFMQTAGKKKVPYQIRDVVPGRSFSILWKALFVRFVFTHEVVSNPFGSEIRYDFKVEGAFAWMVRWLIVPKVRMNLKSVLKTFVQQLEST